MYPWVKFLVNYNLRFVLYLLWFIALPLYFVLNIPRAARAMYDDASWDFTYIKQVKKTNPSMKISTKAMTKKGKL